MVVAVVVAVVVVRYLDAKAAEEAARIADTANWKKKVGFESAALKRAKRLAARQNPPGTYTCVGDALGLRSSLTTLSMPMGYQAPTSRRLEVT